MWLSPVMNSNFLKLTFCSLKSTWVSHFHLHTEGTMVNIWKTYFIFIRESGKVVSFFTLTGFLKSSNNQLAIFFLSLFQTVWLLHISIK